MVIVDVIAGAVIAGAFLWGLRSGLRRMLPIAGFAAGALVGSRLPLLFGGTIDGDFSLVTALPGALVVGAVAGAWAEGRTSRLSRFSRARPRIDQIGGGLATGAAAVVLLWLLAPAVAELRTARDEIDRSEVLARFNSVLQPAGPNRKKTLPPTDNFPRFFGRVPLVPRGDPRVVNDPDIVKAERSVVKIRVRDCRSGGTGSGWIAQDGIVVTNAHVVVDAQDITVQLEGQGGTFAATPIWFDGRNDIALLRVDRLKGVRPLRMAATARAGTAVAALGFPGGRRLTRAGRIGPTTDRLRGRMSGMPDEIEANLGRRLVTTFSGGTGPGSSGGPVVDTGGRVMTTTFGGSGPESALGVPNQFVRRALRSAGPPISVGRCPG